MTTKPDDYRDLTCQECLNGAHLDFEFTMAFQPIVDLESKDIFAYEALVRGINGEPAGSILEKINDSNRYRFDQACRVKAVKLASDLGIEQRLSINFLPNAIYKPENCIQTTIAATRTYNFPIEHIIFEVTEVEQIKDHRHLQNIFAHYKERGFMTAIDDFGSGYAGLALLADFSPHIIKLDMDLIRDIDRQTSRQAIVRGVIDTCSHLDIDVIAEGVESPDELEYLRDMGVSKFQGFLLARPETGRLPEVRFDDFS